MQTGHKTLALHEELSRVKLNAFQYFIFDNYIRKIQLYAYSRVAKNSRSSTGPSLVAGNFHIAILFF